jgi:hypothetical protein
VAFETISQAKSITKIHQHLKLYKKYVKNTQKENDNVEKGFHSYRCQKRKIIDVLFHQRRNKTIKKN